MSTGSILGDLFGTLLIWVAGWSLLDTAVNYGLKRFDADNDVNRMIIYGLLLLVGVLIFVHFLPATLEATQ